MSIDAQVTELKEYAKREGLNIVYTFIESQTAKEPGRPIFNEMLDLMEHGNINGTISWHPDRLARNSVDGGRVIHLIDRGKICALKFPTFWFDNTPQGKFMLNIAFGQSKYYIDNLSENVAFDKDYEELSNFLKTVGLNAQLRERKVELQFKKPFQLLHKTRLRFGALVEQNSLHPYWLTAVV
ncbi:MAG: recombinase family protein [Candidatus Kerfeldbacteria bacterium]|nr:recombinase family protein [Candidatus Kerfeldbacteria bacterium]